MPTLVIATRNAHKVEEIQTMLGGRFTTYLTLRDLPGAPNPEETGATFADNARLKARSIALWLFTTPPAGFSPPEPSQPPEDRWWVLADDSGLEVDALAGAPGVQSARFAAEEFGLTGNAPDAANNAKLLRLLADVPAAQRTGRFRCALALVEVCEGLPTTDFDGACEGRLGRAPRGAQGFGYDPLFTPAGFDQTFAELGESVKNRISHRAPPLARLTAAPGPWGVGSGG